jgi:hypothetical protein
LGGYALPPSLQGRVVAGVSRLKRVHFIGNVYSWSASTALLGRCAAWAAAKGDVRLHLIGGTDPGGATALADLRALQAIESSPAVDSQGESRFSAAMASFAPGSLALDLNENSIERQLAVPIRTVNALMHGVPILSTVDSPLLRRMARAGAAVLADAEGLEQALDQVAALPPKAFAAMSAAARRFAGTGQTRTLQSGRRSGGNPQRRRRASRCRRPPHGVDGCAAHAVETLADPRLGYAGQVTV